MPILGNSQEISFLRSDPTVPIIMWIANPPTNQTNPRLLEFPYFCLVHDLLVNE